MEPNRPRGAELVAAIASWLESYMALSAGYAEVAALWCVLSWCKDQFDIVPYLAITAAVKRAGKTTFGWLLSKLCLGGEIMTNVSGAPFYWHLRETNGEWTPFFDEAELTSREAQSGIGQVLNAGFMAGAAIKKVIAGKTETFPIFGTKAFIMIGDAKDTLRDRSIVMTLTRATAVEQARLRDLSMRVAMSEAESLVKGIKAMLPTVQGTESARPKFLTSSRDRDIWGPIFGLAAALQLDEIQIAKITRVAAITSAEKTHEKRTANAVSESVTEDAAYSQSALLDLRRVFREGEDRILSVVAVQRMRDLPDGGWSVFRDADGLDVNALASLLKRHKVKTKSIRVSAHKTAKSAGVQRGYGRAAVDAAVAALGIESEVR